MMTSLPLLLVVGLFGGRPSTATMVEMAEVPCALGDGIARVYEKRSSNTHGGFDSDLAHYSDRGQFREYAVSSCAENLFSLMGQDMADPAMAVLVQAEPIRTRLLAALQDETSRLATPQDPPVWDRYAIAARMYRELGRDPLYLAELYLTASWTARDRAVGVYMGLEGPAAVTAILEQGEAELLKPLTVAQRKTVTWNLVRVAHRGGLNSERDAYMKAFADLKPLSPAESAALTQLREMVTVVEPRFQDLAMAELQRALRAETIDPDEKVRATYLLADLARRRGRTREAIGLYTLVMNEESAPMNLREMALLLNRQLAGL
jgi:hypothetical protein